MNDSLNEKISRILASDPKNLKRESGDFQFTDVAKEIDTLYDFARDLNNNIGFFEQLPEDQQQALINLLENIANTFDLLNNFKPATITNPQDIRNSYAQTVKTYFSQSYTYRSLLDVYILKTTGSQANLSEITKEAKQVLEEAKKDYKEIKQLTETAKKSTAKIPVYKYLGIFNEEAASYSKKSYIWLFISTLFTILLLALLWIISSNFANDIAQLKSTQAIIGFLAVKLFFLAIIVYVLQQCIRNYMANMHLSVLNKHRENSLKVFDAMVQSTTNPDTTDQVLTLLSQSIFESGDTGFFPGKDISKDGPDIVQIVKESTKLK